MLPTYPEALSAKAAARSCGELGVEVRPGQRVTDVDADGVTIGERAARRADHRLGRRRGGLAAGPLAGRAARPRRPGAGRARPDASPATRGVRRRRPGGDRSRTASRCPACAGGDAGRAHVAREHPPTRWRQARARPSATSTRAASPPSAGRGRGQTLGRFKLSGLLAWLGWLFIHIFFLIGFRNRLLVLIDWAYSYLFFRSGARLITGEDRLEKLLGAAPADPIRSSGGGVR